MKLRAFHQSSGASQTSRTSKNTASMRKINYDNDQINHWDDSRDDLRRGEENDDDYDDDYDDDDDSYTCTLVSRDNEDGEETMVSQEWSTGVDDDCSRYTRNIEKIASDDEDEDATASVCTFDTDAEKTLTTIEERHFEEFVREQEELIEAASHEQSNGGHDATTTEESRCCANFFELCGYLGEEIAKEIRPLPRESRRLEREQSEQKSIFDEDEDNEESDDDQESVKVEEEPEEQSVIDIIEVKSESIGDYTSRTEPTVADADITKIEEPIAPPAIAIENATVALENKKVGRWRNIRPSMGMLSRLRGSQSKVHVVNHVHGTAQEADCANVTEENKNTLPDAEDSRLVPDSTKSPSRSKPSKLLLKLRKKSRMVHPAAALAAMLSGSTRKYRSIDVKASNVDNLATYRGVSTPGTIVNDADDIPFTASILGRAKSIARENFHELISQEESPVKEVKKVRIGTDEDGNDRFAYLVFMDGSNKEAAIGISSTEDDPSKQPSCRLVRGKVDETYMELALARTESAMDAEKQQHYEISPDGNHLFLMEVDEIPLPKDEVKTDTLLKESQATAQIPELHAEAAGAENENIPCENEPCLANNPEEQEPPGLFPEKSAGSKSKSLSFESVIAATISSPDGVSRDASGFSSHHSLLLMEVGDEDEIEIEWEGMEEAMGPPVNEASSVRQLHSIPSDGAVVFLDQPTTQDEPSLNQYEKSLPNDINQKRKLKSDQCWKSKKQN